MTLFPYSSYSYNSYETCISESVAEVIYTCAYLSFHRCTIQLVAYCYVCFTVVVSACFPASQLVTRRIHQHKHACGLLLCFSFPISKGISNFQFPKGNWKWWKLFQFLFSSNWKKLETGSKQAVIVKCARAHNNRNQRGTAMKTQPFTIRLESEADVFILMLVCEDREEAERFCLDAQKLYRKLYPAHHWTCSIIE